jgi:sortase A
VTTLFRNSRHQRRTLVIVESLFLIVGFLCLGWAGYMTAQRLLFSSWQNYNFEQSLQGQDTSVVGYLKYLSEGNIKHGDDEQPAIEPAPPAQTPTSPKSAKSRKLQRDEFIGRIEIPRVKVSAIVKEGVDTTTLSRAVGHVPYTSLPGEVGNVGVAAHRDTFFRGLRNIREGDTIRVVTVDGVYLYQVADLKIVWPKNVEVLDPTPDERLTLVTCYPFNYVGSAPKRFIVQAKKVGFEELEARAKSRIESEAADHRPKAGS